MIRLIFPLIASSMMLLTSSYTSLKNTNGCDESSCNLIIEEVNDSTYIIHHGNISYPLKDQVFLGNPVITISNDTISVSGSNFNYAITVSNSNGCYAHKVINKF